MKKAVLLTAIILISALCKAGIKVTVSGKISNISNAEVMVLDFFGPHKIPVKADGTFSREIELDAPGKYYFGAGESGTPIYLRENSNVIITADSRDLLNTIRFKGTDANENTYLVQKQLLTNQYDYKSFYSLDEKAYLAKLAKRKSDMIAAMAASNISNSKFRELENRDIFYLEQSELWNYPIYHPDAAKKENFVLAPDFPKPDRSKINFNSGEDYAFSMPYREMTSRRISETLPPDSGRDGVFEAVMKFDDPYMRDVILFGMGYDINSSNPDAKKMYDKLMAVVKSERARKDFTDRLAAIESTKPGKTSPTFNFENVDGSKTSLESFKGKYVYIDVWATWCGPCREEIPSLEKIEKAYHGKKIAFISLSADRQKDREKWKNMIADNKMGGIQLLADKDFDSDFIQAYKIDGIPRFILIDPAGKIVNPHAPRPSDPELVTLLDSLQL